MLFIRGITCLTGLNWTRLHLYCTTKLADAHQLPFSSHCLTSSQAHSHRTLFTPPLWGDLLMGRVIDKLISSCRFYESIWSFHLLLVHLLHCTWICRTVWTLRTLNSYSSASFLCNRQNAKLQWYGGVWLMHDTTTHKVSKESREE